MINCVAWSPAGALFAAGLYQGGVIVWNAATGQRVQFIEFRQSDETVFVSFVTETKLVVFNGDVQQWDIATGTKRFDYVVPGESNLNNAALSPSRKLLMVPGSSLDNFVLDAATGALIQTMPESGLCAAFSGDDQYAVIEAGWGNMTLNRVSDGRRVQFYKSPGDGDPHTDVDISLDGKYLLSSPYQSVIVCEAATGTPVNRWLQAGEHARFSPDGHTVVRMTMDGVIRLWDFRANREIRQFNGHQPVSYHGEVKFSPDGRYLLSGSDDGTARIWDFHTGQEILRVKAD